MKNLHTRPFPLITLRVWNIFRHFCRSNDFYRTLQAIKQQMRMNIDTVTRYAFISGIATYMYKISRAISASKLQGVQTFPPHQRVNKAPAVFKEQTYLGKNSRVILWVTHNVRAASLFSWRAFICVLFDPRSVSTESIYLLSEVFCILARSFTFAHVHWKRYYRFHMKSIWRKNNWFLSLKHE